MKLPRRQFLHLAAGAAALPAVGRSASGQAYPARPMRMVAPFTGGSADIIARLIGQWLSERLGQKPADPRRAFELGRVLINRPAISAFEQTGY
jgi:hypothetical protein